VAELGVRSDAELSQYLKAVEIVTGVAFVLVTVRSLMMRASDVLGASAGAIR